MKMKTILLFVVLSTICLTMISCQGCNPFLPDVPQRITDFSMKEKGTNYVILRWSLPKNSSSIEKCFIFRDGIRVADVSKSTTDYKDINLKENTVYVYEIAGVNSNDDIGEKSDKISVTTKFIPPKINNFKVSTNEYNKVVLIWDKPLYADKYNLKRSDWSDAKELQATSTGYEDREVSQKMTYKYQVTVVYDGVEGMASDELSVTTPEEPHADIQLVNWSWYVDEVGWWHISGTMKNIGNRDAYYIKYYYRFKDTYGNIAKTGYDYADLTYVTTGDVSSFYTLGVYYLNYYTCQIYDITWSEY